MFGQKFGRKNSRTAAVVSSVTYSRSSCAVLRQREVRVRLGEPELGEPVHDLRPGERLGQEDHLGVLGLDLRDQPLPERERLRVRVVDAEDAHAVADPEAHDVEQRRPTAPASPRDSNSSG